jgi:hypothetical protein
MIFQSLGLPEGYPYAKFLLHLRPTAKLDAFRQAHPSAGKHRGEGGPTALLLPAPSRRPT